MDKENLSSKAREEDMSVVSVQKRALPASSANKTMHSNWGAYENFSFLIHMSRIL
ncbi:MAG: hypothetical protein ACI4AA_04760 [Lachnospiraceae bacterium]